MQNFKEELKDYSDTLGTEFSDFEDGFFSENVQFSDIENIFQSQHLIKNLQSTNNSTSNETDMPSLFHEFHSNVAALKFKEVKLAKIWSLNKSRDINLRKKRNQTNNLCKKKVTTNIRKHPDEDSDFEDFCAPKKKLKKSEIESDLTRTNIPLNSVNNETNNMSIVEMPKSQSDMSVSSTQESQTNQETGNTQTEMNIAGSQESSISQKQLSQNSSLSPKRIASSQESLGNKIMSISFDEKTISNDIGQSKTHIAINQDSNSEYQQILAREAIETSSINQSVNPQKLNIYNQQSSISSTLQSKNVKEDYPENEKFTVNIVSSAQDIYCNKNDRRHNRIKNRCMWNIRKRELEVTTREKALRIREKLLDVREAEIHKREAIIKARDMKYLRYKSKKITKLLKQKITSKNLKKIGVLVDDTNTQFDI